jgi:uncharacterized protein YgfB (UPF0149 family)
MTLEEAVAEWADHFLSGSRRVSARQVAMALGECQRRVERIMDDMAARGEMRSVAARPRRANAKATKYYERGEIC